MALKCKHVTFTQAALIIPDYDADHPRPYPGGIKSGEYPINKVVALLRKHAGNPRAVRFIADMMEE